jgi:anti-sigma factor RsiW
VITHEDLMRYLDGELSRERAREVEAAMETSTELRRDYVVFRRMKSDLGAMGAEMRADGTVWTTVNQRLTRPAGWILFVVGAVVWATYGVYHYLMGGEALWAKLATGAVVVGLGMLLLSAIVDRVRDLRTDPYREIQR